MSSGEQLQSAMSEIDRKSFDGSSIAEIIAEFPDGDEMPGQMIPVKKLSDAFDSCAKGEGSMKVYLRIRPISNKSNFESTITVESGKQGTAYSGSTSLSSLDIQF